MHVSLIPVAAMASPGQFPGTTAVVFDVLRATSSIVTALAAGYQKVYPVTDMAAALKLAQSHGYALAGERGGEKIAGFPYGNSPLEFWTGPQQKRKKGEVEGDREGKTDVLVLTTSNGTAAIEKAAGASRVFIGSLLNARAVAMAALEEGRDIVLVCAGTGGQFALEDALGAGFVLAEIVSIAGATATMGDAARAVYALSRFYKDDPLGGLLDSSHGQKLQKIGGQEDLRWCAQLNRFHMVPVFSQNYIALE